MFCNRCETVQQMLEGLAAQRGNLQPRLEVLERDVMQLNDWAAGLSEKRDQLHGSLTSLRDAVTQIEERTSAITKDFANKVSSVRTDVRRMDGLRSELDSVLSQVGDLEDKTSQVERSMVKRIGDVLGSSVDRVSNLRSASERNTQAIDQLRKRIPELVAVDDQISDRLRELESGRARLVRTLTFAADLKPKVASIKRDFGAFEPQVSDLTLRIGRLAEDLSEREREIAELRQTLLNLTAVEGDLSVTTKQKCSIKTSDSSSRKQIFITRSVSPPDPPGRFVLHLVYLLLNQRAPASSPASPPAGSCFRSVLTLSTAAPCADKLLSCPSYLASSDSTLLLISFLSLSRHHVHFLLHGADGVGDLLQAALQGGGLVLQGLNPGLCRRQGLPQAAVGVLHHRSHRFDRLGQRGDLLVARLELFPHCADLVSEGVRGFVRFLFGHFNLGDNFNDGGQLLFDERRVRGVAQAGFKVGQLTLRFALTLGELGHAGGDGLAHLGQTLLHRFLQRGEVLLPGLLDLPDALRQVPEEVVLQLLERLLHPPGLHLAPLHAAHGRLQLHSRDAQRRLQSVHVASQRLHLDETREQSINNQLIGEEIGSFCVCRAPCLSVRSPRALRGSDGLPPRLVANKKLQIPQLLSLRRKTPRLPEGRGSYLSGAPEARGHSPRWWRLRSSGFSWTHRPGLALRSSRCSLRRFGPNECERKEVALVVQSWMERVPSSAPLWSNSVSGSAACLSTGLFSVEIVAVDTLEKTYTAKAVVSERTLKAAAVSARWALWQRPDSVPRML
ncbi:hypothetical protein CCH79_00015249 [Gambusia affinis]|uniref:Uncharacterized protein n=1 Tax=Gambusia affinis TaxID=33528 RepID=A0A315VRI2_GAMAF|nr:hypothetical protein CCH79_00015249 [Gambusia affinis]